MENINAFKNHKCEPLLLNQHSYIEYKDKFDSNQHETAQEKNSKKTKGIISCLINLITNSLSDNEKEEQKPDTKKKACIKKHAYISCQQ